LTKLGIVTNNQEQTHIGAFAAAKLLVTCFLRIDIFFASTSGSLLYVMFLLFSWVLLKKKAENSQNMATNIRLFLN